MRNSSFIGAINGYAPLVENLLSVMRSFRWCVDV